MAIWSSTHASAAFINNDEELPPLLSTGFDILNYGGETWPHPIHTGVPRLLYRQLALYLAYIVVDAEYGCEKFVQDFAKMLHAAE